MVAVVVVVKVVMVVMVVMGVDGIRTGTDITEGHIGQYDTCQNQYSLLEVSQKDDIVYRQYMSVYRFTL